MMEVPATARGPCTSALVSDSWIHIALSIPAWNHSASSGGGRNMSRHPCPTVQVLVMSHHAAYPLHFILPALLPTYFEFLRAHTNLSQLSLSTQYPLNNDPNKNSLIQSYPFHLESEKLTHPSTMCRQAPPPPIQQSHPPAPVKQTSQFRPCIPVYKLTLHSRSATRRRRPIQDIKTTPIESRPHIQELRGCGYGSQLDDVGVSDSITTQ